MKKFCIFLLKVYKATISKVLGRKCIFTPTCSVYSMEAYENFGVFSATILTAKRLLRCAPWGKGGFDPLPANKKGDIKWHI